MGGALMGGQSILPFDCDMEIQEVLFDFDGPLSYVALTSKGGLIYAHLYDVVHGNWQYLCSLISQEELDSLKASTLPIRDVWDARPLWLVTLGKGNDVIDVVATELKDLPEDSLPKRGVCLLPKEDE